MFGDQHFSLGRRCIACPMPRIALRNAPSQGRNLDHQIPVNSVFRVLKSEMQEMKRFPLNFTAERKLNCRPACKPGSVRRAKPARRPFIWDANCSAPLATYPDSWPGKNRSPEAPHHPYSVLLPVGFTMPHALPYARWALTPPFHPDLERIRGGLLSVALSLGLPPPDVIRHRISMEPGLSSPPRFHALAERSSSRPALLP